ncbi:MAG TPA: hypothetical protein PKA95_18550, partial [Thermomicrobiales bacterium]|nr:hypothetical protein [Thermomicrobiales bacterium]
TNTAVPTNTQTPTSYLNVEVRDGNGASQLPAGVTIESNTLKAFTKVPSDLVGEHCGGTLVATFALPLPITQPIRASQAIAPGDYCVELSAEGYYQDPSNPQGPKYYGSLFSNGLGTVGSDDPNNDTDVIITVTLANVE